MRLISHNHQAPPRILSFILLIKHIIFVLVVSTATSSNSDIHVSAFFSPFPSSLVTRSSIGSSNSVISNKLLKHKKSGCNTFLPYQDNLPSPHVCCRSSFVPLLFATTKPTASDENVKNNEKTNTGDSVSFSFDNFLSSLFSPKQSSSSPLPSLEKGGKESSDPKILLLGSTGFLGKTISKELMHRNIPCVHVSRSQRQESNNDDNNQNVNICLDLTSTDAANQIKEIIQRERCTAVISTVGSIMGSSSSSKQEEEEDFKINASTGNIASSARKGGATRFVYVSNSPRVGEFAETIPFLQSYRKGKIYSEQLIQKHFDKKSNDDDDDGSTSGYCIICPTFIFGGDEFGARPPRLPQTIGAVLEEILGLYPFQALSEVMPGFLGIALESPVGVDNVAKACVNSALGLCDSYDYLDSKEDIVMVASKRFPPVSSIKDNNMRETEEEKERRRQVIKTKLVNLGDGNEEAFSLIEELEYLKPLQTKPAYDDRLNGLWDFNFSVEPDLGTGVVKSLLEQGGDDQDGQSSFLFSLDSVGMNISNNEKIEITVSTRVLRLPVTLKLYTSLLHVDEEDTNSEDGGTLFMEKFEGVSLFDIHLPIPQSWKRSRYLEFSYLDDDMVVARGNGREPHFLLRKQKSEEILQGAKP
mmetsp:Transcript_55574/g.82617  ORF Transcript_55574/g.82617 Transcript_55574/m.82617 type:complete len:643 (+) Transcript_55574:219-2147(+)